MKFQVGCILKWSGAKERLVPKSSGPAALPSASRFSGGVGLWASVSPLSFVFLWENYG